MTKRRFAAVTTTRLDLSGGDWIEVKDELTYGERLTLSNAPFVGNRDGLAIIDYTRYHLKRMEIYITDWNLAGPDGKTTEPSPALFALLDEESADEINRAIDAHIVSKLGNAATTGKNEPEKNPKSDSANDA